MDCDGLGDVDVVAVVVVIAVEWVTPADTPPIELVLLILFFLTQDHSIHLSILLIIPYIRTSIVSMTGPAGGVDKFRVALIFS